MNIKLHELPVLTLQRIDTGTFAQVDKHLLGLAVTSLPGVGWSTKQKLHAMRIQTVADLRLNSQDNLQQELGTKNGALLW